jgi:hypothetical protein
MAMCCYAPIRASAFMDLAQWIFLIFRNPSAVSGGVPAQVAWRARPVPGFILRPGH